jgi:hypothetical protein
MKRLLVLSLLVSCCGTANNKGVIKRGGHYDADITNCYMHNVHHIDTGNMPRKICISESEDVIEKLKNNYYLDRYSEYRIEKAETDIWVFADQIPVIILERIRS